MHANMLDDRRDLKLPSHAVRIWKQCDMKPLCGPTGPQGGSDLEHATEEVPSSGGQCNVPQKAQDCASWLIASRTQQLDQRVVSWLCLQMKKEIKSKVLCEHFGCVSLVSQKHHNSLLLRLV